MKRRIALLAIVLLVGAVVNVAVAWACTPIRPVGPTLSLHEARRNPEGGWDYWLLEENRRAGGVHYWSYYELGVELEDPQNTDPMPSEIAPAWGGLAAPFEAEYDYRDIHGSGWPVISMWCEYANGSTVIRGLELDRSQPFTAMPLDVTWPGFAVNTLFYSAILWLGIRGPFIVRRFIRVRRGRCARCGYPIGSSPQCTECGHQLSARSVTS